MAKKECLDCGELKVHFAKGLCKLCYNRQYDVIRKKRWELNTLPGRKERHRRENISRGMKRNNAERKSNENPN